MAFSRQPSFSLKVEGVIRGGVAGGVLLYKLSSGAPETHSSAIKSSNRKQHVYVAVSMTPVQKVGREETNNVSLTRE